MLWGDLWMNLRYGKYQISDHATTFFGSVVLTIAGVTCLSKDILPVIYPILAFTISFFMVMSTFKSCRERFMITQDSITVINGRHNREISLPLRPLVVISYASAQPSYAASSPISLELGTNILPDRYMVSVLQNMPLASALDMLHKGYVKRYTNVTIENQFHYRVLYSFVCDAALLDQFLENRDCLVITPESIYPQYADVIMKNQGAGLYIDRGY